MKILLIVLCFVSLHAFANSEQQLNIFKPVISESQIHPDKKISIFVKGLKDGGSCDSESIREARELIQNCRGGGTGGNNRAECISGMKTFFGKRSATSSDQDSGDAVGYCSRRYTTINCATSTHEFTRKRSGSTSDDDITDAANFCRKRGDFSCLAPTHAELSRRSGTTSDDDVNDTLSTCSN